MIKIILIVVVLLFIIAMLLFRSFLKLNTIQLSPNEIIKKGDSDKKALVLYQKTKHDTATNITTALAEELNSNGYTVTINHPSTKLSYNLDEYDFIAFGSGVYMGTTSQPLKDYIEKHSYEGKDVMVYTVGGSLDEKSDLNNLKEIVKRARKLDGIKVKKGEEDIIKKFVKKFIQN